MGHRGHFRCLQVIQATDVLQLLAVTEPVGAIGRTNALEVLIKHHMLDLVVIAKPCRNVLTVHHLISLPQFRDGLSVIGVAHLELMVRHSEVKRLVAIAP